MNHLNSILLLLLLIALPTILAAQDKFGYIDTQELLVIMPEYKAAEDSLQAYAHLLQANYMKLQEDYDQHIMFNIGCTLGISADIMEKWYL